jgi:hypothetical protein
MFGHIPRQYPAFQIFYVVAHARKIRAGIGASIPDPAVDHDLFIFRQLIDPMAQFLERQQVGSGDGLRSVFLVRTYIEQEKIITRLYFFDQIFRPYILTSTCFEKHCFLLPDSGFSGSLVVSR